MGAQAVLQHEAIQVYDYRCTAGPGDSPFTELHAGHSLSYVRKGSFGYRVRGQTFELVAGSILVGHPGDEYVCTHDHARLRRRVPVVPAGAGELSRPSALRTRALARRRACRRCPS